jgi:hypothetical protein
VVKTQVSIPFDGREKTEIDIYRHVRQGIGGGSGSTVKGI